MEGYSAPDHGCTCLGVCLHGECLMIASPNHIILGSLLPVPCCHHVASSNQITVGSSMSQMPCCDNVDVGSFLCH